ncbi:DUF6911 family protein [Aeromonas hydrophila]|uniref:DUF6911 family protein n=1 Tax=Aeromonas hydrophila TaxID=644 RepID=UPI00235FAC55|nr:hypothetical protein [Aeromonas hydrophila]
MITSYSWTLNGKGGSQKNPTWNDIYDHLRQLVDGAGTLSIDIVDIVDSGPDFLQVRAENNHFMVMLGEVTEDDYNVRNYMGGVISNNKVEVLGDYWPESQLTKDFEFVVRVFKEFFETGNVSTSLLN